MCDPGDASIWLRMAFVVPGLTRNAPNLIAENAATNVSRTAAMAATWTMRGSSPRVSKGVVSPSPFGRGLGEGLLSRCPLSLFSSAREAGDRATEPPAVVGGPGDLLTSDL